MCRRQPVESSLSMLMWVSATSVRHPPSLLACVLVLVLKFQSVAQAGPELSPPASASRVLDYKCVPLNWG